MKQNGTICTFQKTKHFFISLLYLAFIKATNVLDHFAGPCISITTNITRSLLEQLAPLKATNYYYFRLECVQREI